MQNIQKNVDLYTKEECPHCHFTFTSGYNPDKELHCVSCNNKFIRGQKIDHGRGCSICSNRNYGSNNVYYKDGCPAIMSDGRFITYYNSTNELTESMRKLNGFMNPNQFRNFMQRNAHLFIQAERDFLNKNNTCNPSTACSEGWYNLKAKNNGVWK